MAAKNEYLDETVKTLYTLSSDEMIQEACRRRDDYNRQINRYITTIDEQASTIEQQHNSLLEKDAHIAELEALLAKQK